MTTTKAVTAARRHDEVTPFVVGVAKSRGTCPLDANKDDEARFEGGCDAAQEVSRLFGIHRRFVSEFFVENFMCPPNAPVNHDRSNSFLPFRQIRLVSHSTQSFGNPTTWIFLAYRKLCAIFTQLRGRQIPNQQEGKLTPLASSAEEEEDWRREKKSHTYDGETGRIVRSCGPMFLKEERKEAFCSGLK